MGGVGGCQYIIYLAFSFQVIISCLGNADTTNDGERHSMRHSLKKTCRSLLLASLLNPLKNNVKLPADSATARRVVN